FGRLAQEAGRPAGAEDRRRGAAAEAGTGRRPGAALHEDQRHHGDRDQDEQDVEHVQQHRVGSVVQRAAAAMMARKSAAASEAPPISPPSTSGCENSALALSGLQLPPYRIGSKPAIVALCFATSPRMNAWTAWACSGEAVRPVPIAQTGS